jgi:hypothetical protein
MTMMANAQYCIREGELDFSSRPYEGLVLDLQAQPPPRNAIYSPELKAELGREGVDLSTKTPLSEPAQEESIVAYAWLDALVKDLCEVIQTPFYGR